jgi:hypothetical protein
MLVHLIWGFLCVCCCLVLIRRIRDAQRTGTLRLIGGFKVSRSDDDFFWFRYWMLTAWTVSIALPLMVLFVILRDIWLSGGLSS